MLVIAIVLFVTGSWLFKVGPLADISGYWVFLVGLIAFVWFEFVEPLLGLDKRKKADESLQKSQEERLQRLWGRKKKK